MKTEINIIKSWIVFGIHFWSVAPILSNLDFTDFDDSCSLPVSSLPKKEPLMTVGTQLVLPDSEGNVVVAQGQRLDISCPGAGFEHLQEQHVVASCDPGGVVNVHNHLVTTHDLGCTAQVTGEVLVLSEGCGGSGTLMELGFRVGGAWHGVIQVCHHNATSATLYSSHLLHGPSLPSSSKKNQKYGRPRFQDGNVYKFNPNNFYKKTSQSQVLSSILGGEKYANKYIGKTFLARGHLAPNSDFILDPYQDVTFFYINVAPQWQAINGGNWVSLERRIRSFAESHSKTLKIITGTHGVLSLEGRTGEKQEVWLYRRGGEMRLPVPLFLWKVVFDPEEQAGIAFVSLNAVGVEGTRAELPCPDVCEVTGWAPSSGSWGDPGRGLLYCCEVGRLRQAVPHLPQVGENQVLGWQPGGGGEEETAWDCEDEDFDTENEENDSQDYW